MTKACTMRQIQHLTQTVTHKRKCGTGHLCIVLTWITYLQLMCLYWHKRRRWQSKQQDTTHWTTSFSRCNSIWNSHQLSLGTLLQSCNMYAHSGLCLSVTCW